ncbi:hypothetical protein CR513_28145, partial [Mucuna pruriens]
MSPYRIFIFRKACHLLIEIKYRAYWAIKRCNMAYDKVDKERKLQLQELEELRLEAYENSRIYKKKLKQFHDNKILKKELRVDLKVLLFHSRLKLIVGKLRSRWDGPFVITNIFPYGIVELRDKANNRNFKVNGHQIKPFHEGSTPMVGKVESISLMEPALVLSLRRRLSEVIDWYSWRGLVERNFKAWTNLGEPPQSPPGSLPAKEPRSCRIHLCRDEVELIPAESKSASSSKATRISQDVLGSIIRRLG